MCLEKLSYIEEEKVCLKLLYIITLERTFSIDWLNYSNLLLCQCFIVFFVSPYSPWPGGGLSGQVTRHTTIRRPQGMSMWDKNNFTRFIRFKATLWNMWHYFRDISPIYIVVNFVHSLQNVIFVSKYVWYITDITIDSLPPPLPAIDFPGCPHHYSALWGPRRLCQYSDTVPR